MKGLHMLPGAEAEFFIENQRQLERTKAALAAGSLVFRAPTGPDNVGAAAPQYQEQDPFYSGPPFSPPKLPQNRSQQ